MRKGYVIGTHLINPENPGVDRKAGLHLGDTHPAPTLTISSYSSVCMSSPKGLSLPDPAEFSHGSVFLTTAGCQGNYCQAQSQRLSSLQGNSALTHLSFHSCLLAWPQETLPNPKQGALPPCSGTFPWGWGQLKEGSKAGLRKPGPQNQSGSQIPYHPSPSLVFQCKLFIKVSHILSAQVLSILLNEFHKLHTQ